MRLIRGAQRRLAQSSHTDAARFDMHPNDEDEVHLVAQMATPPVEESSVNFGFWMMAIIVAVALLVMIVSRC
jgi:hypothetical protein